MNTYFALFLFLTSFTNRSASADTDVSQGDNMKPNVRRLQLSADNDVSNDTKKPNLRGMQLSFHRDVIEENEKQDPRRLQLRDDYANCGPKPPGIANGYEECGEGTDCWCSPNEFCCNSSCGICAPQNGGSCIQPWCGDDSGGDDKEGI